MSADSYCGMNEAMRQKKALYIPQFVAGKITNKQCAALIGISTVSVSRIKKRYLLKGDGAFIHGHTGKPSHNRKFSAKDKNNIVDLYKKYFPYAPFEVFLETLQTDFKKNISYTSVYTILDNAGMMSPKAHKPIKEKKKHLPRPERPHEGELVQLDGCKHDWFMNGHYTCIHGCIDDATHKATSLYMMENECLMGYQQNIRQTYELTGGFPEAAYTDRSEIFFVTKESLNKITIEEQLQGYEKRQTQWQKMCKELNVKTIAALSPQAKGRIERLWETLQGRLPYLFRYYGIDTIEKANDFLREYLPRFNALFSVEARESVKRWHRKQIDDVELLFSVKSEHTAKANGTFVYHGEKFRVNLPFKKFTLCVSPTIGVKAFYNGRYYDVELAEPLQDTISDSMPIVEKELIRRYFYRDGHSNLAEVR